MCYKKLSFLNLIWLINQTIEYSAVTLLKNTQYTTKSPALLLLTYMPTTVHRIGQLWGLEAANGQLWNWLSVSQYVPCPKEISGKFSQCE